MNPEAEPHVLSGPWDTDEIRGFLEETAIPIRLATQGSQGPLVQSVWFRFDGDAIWCCTQADSVLARRLRRDPRCGFEVAADTPPYRGVRGRAVAEFHTDRSEEVLNDLIDRYLDDDNPQLAEWLQSRVDDEVAIRLGQLRLSTWDYSPRMS